MTTTPQTYPDATAAAVATDNMALLRELQTKPVIAWPTIIMLLCSIPPILYLDYLAIMQEMNVVTAALIASVFGYFSFSSIHDGLHRAVSSKGWINEMVSMLTVNLLFPYQPIAVLRWGHMQHHVHTGDPEKDPDHPTVKSFWGMLVRGLFWADVYYTWNYFKHASQRPAREVRNVKLHLLIGGTIFVVASILLPIEALIFWFIASRLTQLSIALVFMYLPHVPHHIVQKDAPYQATLIREGWDWLMTPLLAYQNWHLVHHLYPSVPFYRYKKLWNARRQFHEAQLPGRVSAFQLTPDAQALAAGVALAKTSGVRIRG
ncbi:MAG: fatty acid desaturase [Moraxellaceae bacterium]|nr:fatty acid desaturase [Moraxellaceae bacterium]